MTRSAIADAGPLVAAFDRRERYHRWSVERLNELTTPILICEPVLVESMYLLAADVEAQDRLFELVERKVLSLAFSLDEHLSEVRSLMRKYRDQPMSLADACLVRMSEVFDDYAIFTLDSHFTVYRKEGRDPIEVLMPARD